jgi:hypothetical protein
VISFVPSRSALRWALLAIDKPKQHRNGAFPMEGHVVEIGAGYAF